MSYKVENLKDDIYQVYWCVEDAEPDEWECVFQGNLSDCKAYIDLDKNGYL